MVINTETYSRPKDEKLIRNSAPKWAICSTPPHPRAQGLLQKEAKESKQQRKMTTRKEWLPKLTMATIAPTRPA